MQGQNELFFTDGRRSIDFVLAHQLHPVKTEVSETFIERRRVFQANLVDEGLELEEEEFPEANLKFFKIHAPLEVLTRYAELMKFRMPMSRVSSFPDFCLSGCCA
jgi:hypothetical protein